MLKYFITGIFIFMMFFFSSGVRAQADTIDVQKFIELQNEGYKVIDVRTPEEFSEGFIEGAVNINFLDTEFKANIDKLDKEGNYLVYCKSGGRSKKALHLMKDIGFINVYSLTGGIKAWSAEGNPLSK